MVANGRVERSCLAIVPQRRADRWGASVLRAAEAGTTADEITAVLRDAAGREPPANVVRQVRDWLAATRRVSVAPAVLVECPDEETAARVLAAGGTASEATIPGYELAGKTGTANKVDETTGEYSESRYIASFVGFAPAAKPRLLVTVMVDEPNGAIYGGEVAAPAFQEITSFALNYLRIPPE